MFSVACRMCEVFVSGMDLLVVRVRGHPVAHVPAPELHLAGGGRGEGRGSRGCGARRATEVDRRHLVVLVPHVKACRVTGSMSVCGRWRNQGAGCAAALGRVINEWLLAEVRAGACIPQSFCMRLGVCSSEVLPAGRWATMTRSARHMAAATPVARSTCRK